MVLGLISFYNLLSLLNFSLNKKFPRAHLALSKAKKEMCHFKSALPIAELESLKHKRYAKYTDRKSR